MLVWLTLPFYDFCGFRSVAVNSVYKLQFFIYSIINGGFIPVLHSMSTNGRKEGNLLESNEHPGYSAMSGNSSPSGIFLRARKYG